MVAWTALCDSEQGLYCAADANALKPHRINHQGIPHDIPTLPGDEGEKVVVFYQGQTARKMAGQVFPLIDLEATLQGEPLTPVELQSLHDRIHVAPPSSVTWALEHQMQRGGPDHLLQETIMRLQMSSLTTADESDKEEVPLN